MATQQRIAVEITGDSSDLERALRRATNGMSVFNRATTRAGNTKIETPDPGKFTRLSTAAAALGPSLAGAGAAALTATAAVAGFGIAAAGTAVSIKKLADAAAESRAVDQIFSATIRTMNSDIDVGKIDTFVESFSELTGLDDEMLKLAAANAATFKNIDTGTTKDMLRWAAGMEALGKGNTAGNVTQIAKALNDPTSASALVKSGTLTRNEAERVKLLAEQGKEVEARLVLEKALERQYGKSAEAAAKPADRIRVALGNAVEEAGAAFLPMMDQIADAFSNIDLSNLVNVLAPAARMFGAIGAGFKNAFSGAGDIFRDIGDSVARFMTAMTPLAGFVGTIGGLFAKWVIAPILISTLTGMSAVLQTLTQWAGQAAQWVINLVDGFARLTGNTELQAWAARTRGDLDKLKNFDINVEINKSEFDSNVGQVQSQLRGLSKKQLVKLGVDMKGLKEGKREALQQLLSIPKKQLTKLGISNGEFKKLVRSALANLDEIDKANPEATAKVDTTDGQQKLNFLKTELQQFAGIHVSATASVTTTKTTVERVIPRRTESFSNALGLSTAQISKAIRKTGERLWDTVYVQWNSQLNKLGKRINELAKGGKAAKEKAAKLRQEYDKLDSRVQAVVDRTNDLARSIASAVSAFSPSGIRDTVQEAVRGIAALNEQIAQAEAGTEQTVESWAHLDPILEQLRRAQSALIPDQGEINRLMNLYEMTVNAGPQQITTRVRDEAELNRLIAERNALYAKDTYSEVMTQQEQRTRAFAETLKQLRKKLDKKALRELALSGSDSLEFANELLNNAGLRRQYNATFKGVAAEAGNSVARAIGNSLAQDELAQDIKKAFIKGGGSFRKGLQTSLDEKPFKAKIQWDLEDVSQKVKVGKQGDTYNVTINGAIDPEGTARAVKKVLDQHARRVGK